MRLLFISQDFPPAVGGIQTYCFQLAKALSRQIDLRVLAPKQPGDARSDAELGCEVTRVRTAHSSLFGYLTARKSRKLIARYRPDAVLCGQYSSGLGAAISRRFGGPPLVVAVHGRELLLKRLQAPAVAFRRFVLQQADAVIPVSHFTSELLAPHDVAPARRHVVPSGVDYDFFSPKPTDDMRRRLGLENKRVLLCAARHVPRKGIDTTIAAFSVLADDFPDWVMLVLGDGPDRPRLERLAAELRALGRIRFVGRRPTAELPLFYSLADLFAMPARQDDDGSVEGFGLVYLEAGACKTAVVGSFSGGIADAVADGESGLLAPPNDPAALAEILRRLMENDILRERMAAHGFARARRFGWETVARRTLTVIETQVEARRVHAKVA